MEHVFQSEVPVKEIKEIASAVLAKKFAAQHIRDGWVVAEYGLNELVPTTLVGGPMVSSQRELTDDEAFERLAAYAGAVEAGLEAEDEHRTSFLPVPWTIIVKVILSAIAGLL